MKPMVPQTKHTHLMTLSSRPVRGVTALLGSLVLLLGAPLLTSCGDEDDTSASGEESVRCQCSHGEVCVDDVCVANPCANLECGPDGAGGSCGACGANEVCVDGACEVVPCAGLECGPDGAGGSCGECEDGFDCKNGACEPGLCSMFAADCGETDTGVSCGTCGAEERCELIQGNVGTCAPNPVAAFGVTCAPGEACNEATATCEVPQCAVDEFEPGCFVVEQDEDGDGVYETRLSFDQPEEFTLDGGFRSSPRSCEPAEVDQSGVCGGFVQNDEHGNTVYSEYYSPSEDVTGFSRFVLAYDAAGRLVRREEDEGADCTIDSVEEWTYDDEGLETAHRTDTDNDGTWDVEVNKTWEWSADGTVLEMNSDADWGTTSYKWTFDAEGHLLEMVTNRDRTRWT